MPDLDKKTEPDFYPSRALDQWIRKTIHEEIGREKEGKGPKPYEGRKES